MNSLSFLGVLRAPPPSQPSELSEPSEKELCTTAKNKSPKLLRLRAGPWSCCVKELGFEATALKSRALKLLR